MISTKVIESIFSEWVIRGGKRKRRRRRQRREEKKRKNSRRRKGEGREEEGITKLEEEYGGSLGCLEGVVV